MFFIIVQQCFDFQSFIILDGDAYTCSEYQTGYALIVCITKNRKGKCQTYMYSL